MNEKRRQEIRKAIKLMEDADEILAQTAADERNAFDAKPENLRPYEEEVDLETLEREQSDLSFGIRALRAIEGIEPLSK